MSRDLPQLLESIEWNLVARASYQVQPGTVQERLPDRTWLIQNSSVVIVGIKETSPMRRSSWVTGGWASQVLPFLPSSTSQFVAVTENARKWLKLGILNLLIFPKVSDQWVLSVSFPRWFESVDVEVWRYDGEDFTEIDHFAKINRDLERIEQKIDYSD